MDFRRIARWVINIGALIASVLALPQLGAIVPEAWVPVMAAVVSAINMLLSWLRPLVPATVAPK